MLKKPATRRQAAPDGVVVLSDRLRRRLPGCGESPLAAAGCHREKAIGCTAGQNGCAPGSVCLSRSIDPCAGNVCSACAQRITICL